MYKTLSKVENANYAKSNSIESVEYNKMNKAYSKPILNDPTGDYKKREKYANELVSYLCKKYSIPFCKVVVKNQTKPTRQTTSYKITTGGYYTTASMNIVIYNLTAARKQIISNKSFFDTLLHEFMHHYDHTYIKLIDSIHTTGFYKRISDLKNKLI